MFISKNRPIAIPQSEHARLSGIMAHFWGNENFDTPAFDFTDFVLGVTLHDRGYPDYDNLPIDGVPEDVWLGIQKDGILMQSDNPVVDMLSLLQSRRLLEFSEYAGTDELIDLANEHIEQTLKRTSHSLAEFEWADRITRICDSTSFIFSFEQPFTLSLPLSPRIDSEETVMINMTMEEIGTIKMSPWTFSVESIQGYILGYELEGYPERLEPIYLPFSIVQG